jgi:formylglycine-generating enzyme required for sulfatase activity
MALLAANSPVLADNSPFMPAWESMNEQLAAPSCFTSPTRESSTDPSGCSQDQLDAWLKELRLAREEQLVRIGFDDRLYASPRFRWTQSNFVQPQVMIQDRYLYDPSTRRYTVDRFLSDVTKRYGGVDSVLLWHSYPTMGIDDRNQIQMLESLPGGLMGLKQLVAEFHRHGVRVLFPMMLWDRGTNPVSAIAPATLAAVMKKIGADGVNGDTQTGVPRTFLLASEALRHPLVFEPELMPSDEALSYNLMGWGYYKASEVPLVDRFKWIEPRHMVHISDRASKNKKDMLQTAFFNGEGIESWENVWGNWNGLTDWDAEALRRIATIERATAPFLSGGDWQPYAPTLRDGLFASRWQLKSSSLWTLINRNNYSIGGPLLKLPFDASARYFDLYHGVEIRPAHVENSSIISIPIDGSGFGALLEIHEDPDGPIRALIARMHDMTAMPLDEYSSEWHALVQTLEVIKSTRSPSSNPPDMIRIPAADFLFKVKAVQIENLGGAGSDVQYPWESSPRSEHFHLMHVDAFWIDKYPVTNAQFKKFLDSSGYVPADTGNFLKDWKGGTYPAGWDNKPVTWVSREDAQAYAAWAGKRLPNEWEWQYAAQGGDGRIYPWGNAWNSSAVPQPDQGRVMRGPDAVSAHPQGASPFGVMDMVGNVWQWTNAFSDIHTRAAVLRGGSYYKPQRSMWYFPQAYRLDQHERMLLMAPSFDRSGTVGFRCAADQ